MGEARWPSTWQDCSVSLCYASSSLSWPKSQEDQIGSITLSKLKTMMTTLDTRIMTTLALPISKKMKTIADPIIMKLVPTMLVTTIKCHNGKGVFMNVGGGSTRRSGTGGVNYERRCRRRYLSLSRRMWRKCVLFYL